MDKRTREVRKQYWKNIITQCLQRPEGMTVKQWLEDYGICEQTYYHWLKRIRQEAYELATTSDSLPAEVTQNEVTFAGVSFPQTSTGLPDALVRKSSGRMQKTTPLINQRRLFFHRKDHVTLKCKSDELSYETKTLREDRTAAEKKYVACRDPPQAENLASEILCSNSRRAV